MCAASRTLQVSQKWHQSAPYLRLKNSKRTLKSQKTQSIKLKRRVSNSRKTQTTKPASQVPPSALKGGPFRIFEDPLLQNIKKNGGGPFGEKIFSKNSLTVPKKLKGETLWDFSTSILSQNIKKLKGDPLRNNIF